MKNKLTYFLLLILTFSCNKNDFSETEMYFTTDKETYKTGDGFEITLLIYPKDGEKKIRILKNLNNVKISFHSNVEVSGFSQELKKYFIEGPSLTQDESEYLDEFTISNTKPFKKTFKGKISENKQKIILEIPELKISDSIEKSKLLVNPKITIKGNCHTVYSGIQENFTPKDIQIVIK